MTVVAKANHQNALHWHKLVSMGVPIWRSGFMGQLCAFVSSFFFSFLAVPAFGGKIVIMIGKGVLKMFLNLVKRIL